MLKPSHITASVPVRLSLSMIRRHDRADELVVQRSRRLALCDSTTGAEIWWVGGFSIDTMGAPVTGEGILFVSDAVHGRRGEKRTTYPVGSWQVDG